MDYKKCSINCNDRKIVVSENKSRFEIVNESQRELKKIKVDGCLIGPEHEKCDWIISCETPRKLALYVELKGCNIDKAISQLKSTLKLTAQNFNGFERQCFAVTSRIPKQSTTITKKKMDFYRSSGVILNIKNVNNVVRLD